MRNVGVVKETKTGIARRTPIEPRLMPLLLGMHREARGKGQVVAMPRPSELARQLRRYLKLAGVTRHDLFTSDATRSQLTWYHGTRSTGLTWCAVRGDEPMKVMCSEQFWGGRNRI